MSQITTTTATTTVTKTVKLDRKALQRLLTHIVSDIPENASITVQVPGGGNWSNLLLDISIETPIIVEWTETNTVDEQ